MSSVNSRQEIELTGKSSGKNLWLWTVLMFPLTAILSLDRSNMSVSAPIIGKEFHFSLVQISLILAAFWLPYAIFNGISGFFVDRAGARRSLTFAATWWSIFTVLTTIGSSFAGFIGLRALVGAGQGPDWPASERSITDRFVRSDRGKANGILLGGLYFGPIIGTPLTVALIAAFGWRASFYIFGAAGLLMALLWYTFYRDRRSTIEKDQRHAPRVPLRAVLGSGRVWVLGIQAFFYVMVLSFFTNWLPTYLVKSRGFSLQQMGFAATLPSIALFIMVFVAGSLQDLVYRRTDSIYRARIPFAILGFILSAGFLALASISTSRALLITFLVLSQGSIGLLSVTIWAVCADIGGAASGAVTGWTTMWANVANAVGPVFTAIITSLTGNWTLSILLLALSGIIGALLWLTIHPEHALDLKLDTDAALPVEA